MITNMIFVAGTAEEVFVLPGDQATRYLIAGAGSGKIGGKKCYLSRNRHPSHVRRSDLQIFGQIETGYVNRRRGLREGEAFYASVAQVHTRKLKGIRCKWFMSVTGKRFVRILEIKMMFQGGGSLLQEVHHRDMQPTETERRN